MPGSDGRTTSTTMAYAVRRAREAALASRPARPSTLDRAVRDGVAALLDLVLPRECGGCLRAGTTWCRRCAAALDGLALAGPPDPAAGRAAAGVRPPVGGGSWVRPHPTPEAMPPVHAWGVYADPLRAVVAAWKDVGRRDLVAVLAPLLAASAAGAVRDSGWAGGAVLVVPAPSSRRAVRERGDTPMLDLCRAALEQPEGDVVTAPRLAPALEHVRRVADQSGLGTAARRGNLDGALAVKPLWDRVVRGRRCLLVDDVVTTGATLAEAARALRAAGATDVVAAVVAATQRTRG